MAHRHSYLEEANIRILFIIFHFKSHFCITNTKNNSTWFDITVISYNFVHYNREILLIKYAKPNQIITVIEFDCKIMLLIIIFTFFL